MAPGSRSKSETGRSKSESKRLNRTFSDSSDTEDQPEAVEELPVYQHRNPANDQEFDVEAIRDEETIKGKTRYYVKWKGYPEAENTWEPKSSLKHCTEVLKDWKNLRQAKQNNKKVKSSSKDLPRSEAEDSASSSTAAHHKASTSHASKEPAKKNGVAAKSGKLAKKSSVQNHHRKNVIEVESSDEGDNRRGHEHVEDNHDTETIDSDTDRSAEIPMVFQNASSSAKNHSTMDIGDAEQHENGDFARPEKYRPGQGKSRALFNSSRPPPASQPSGSRNNLVGQRLNFEDKADDDSDDTDSQPVPLGKPKWRGDGGYSSQSTSGKGKLLHKPSTSAHSRGKDAKGSSSHGTTKKPVEKKKKELILSQKGVYCQHRSSQTEHVDDDPLTCPVPVELKDSIDHVDRLRQKALCAVHIKAFIPMNKSAPVDDDNVWVLIKFDEPGGKELLEVFPKRVVRFVLPALLIDFYEQNLDLPLSSQVVPLPQQNGSISHHSYHAASPTLWKV